MDSAGKRPRRLRAKYTPRTNLAICTRGISLLRRACVSVLALTDRGAAGNRPALSGVVPPLRRRDNIRGDERRKNGGERWHGTALSRCRSCPMSREEYRIYRTMQKLMVKVQDEARAIKQLMHGELPKLEKQLAETTGLFRGKERKALQEKISGVQQEIDRRMDLLPGILKEDGYPDVQAFKRTYDDATALVEQYNRDLAAWERQVHGGQQPQQKPPEKESIRKKLRDMEAEAKRRNDARRQQTRPRSHDYDRGR